MRIATSIRVLIHETSESIPLLKQIDITPHPSGTAFRRLLNPVWKIVGASDWEAPFSATGNGAPWPPYELSCLVRDRIQSGRLYRLHNAKCWAGPATGKICAVCEQRIVAGTECEVGEPDSAVFAHLVCHGLWCQESRGQSSGMNRPGECRFTLNVGAAMPPIQQRQNTF